MSEILEMWKRHENEIDELRNRCKHPIKDIIIKKDYSCVGAGCLYPSIIVTCTNCGKKKIMFRQTEKEYKIKPLKTLKRQAGIKDQRLDCYARFYYELDK
jgi:hypothetical protein